MCFKIKVNYNKIRILYVHTASSCFQAYYFDTFTYLVQVFRTCQPWNNGTISQNSNFLWERALSGKWRLSDDVVWLALFLTAFVSPLQPKSTHQLELFMKMLTRRFAAKPRDFKPPVSTQVWEISALQVERCKTKVCSFSSTRKGVCKSSLFLFLFFFPLWAEVTFLSEWLS